MSFSVAYAFAYNCFLATIAILSMGELNRFRPSKRPRSLVRTRLQQVPGVSIIVPAYNEESIILETVNSLFNLNYPDVEVIVVSDGSTDRTVDLLISKFGLRPSQVPIPGPLETKQVRAVYRAENPSIIVIDKAPSGAKADGSNCGLNVAQNPWVAVMDADELVQPDTILRCMTEVMHCSTAPVAVGTTLLPSNEAEVENGRIVKAPVPKNYWAGCQLIEYLNSFLMFRPGMSRLGGTTNISGGFGLFRREILLEIGGYRNGHLGEDMDVVSRIQRYMKENGRSFSLLQVPEAIVWTQLPASRAVLKKQRMRWHRGLGQVLWANRAIVGRPSYGRYALLGLPPQYLFEWLGAILELLGWLVLLVLAGIGVVSWPLFISITALGLTTATAVSLIGVWAALHHLEIYGSGGDRRRLLLWALAAQIGYRQLVVFWRVKSLAKRHGGWGEMPREAYVDRSKVTSRHLGYEHERALAQIGAFQEEPPVV